MARLAAGVASFHMATQGGGATGKNGAPHLGLGNRQGMSGEISRAVTAQHVGQAHPGGGANHVERSARRQVEQVQRRRSASQTSARQMHIAHGRADVTVAEEVLDGRQVHAGFDQVSGKGVAQGVDAAFRRNAGGVASGAVDPLRRTQIDRRGARDVGKQLPARPTIAPVMAQPVEQ